MSPRRLLPETMIGGAGFIDFDNDGWIDFYLVTGSTCDFYTPEKPRRNALFRNNRDGTFSEVTDKAGVPGRGFGSGVAVGDYNADGYPDLYVTGVRFGILYRNNGNGTFTDVTSEAGVEARGWSASAAWADLDGDGDLDLWVCGYVIWEPDINFKCGGGETPRYCIPTLFDGWPSKLYLNRGDGTFEDASTTHGIANSHGKGLGVVIADLNEDGRMDVLQSNDTVENFLYMNRGDHFEDVALVAGVAFSYDGKTRSGMGVDAQDYDDDGRIDLFVANIDHEDVSVYRNLGNESFEDIVAEAPEMIQSTRFMSTFGARFVDLDNDGDEDIVVTNGHPDDQIDLHRGYITYLEKPQYFENQNGNFKNRSADAGPVFQIAVSGRGLATGDIDNDGDLDLLFLNSGQPVVLARNDGGNQNSWIGLKLEGTRSNREGIGCRITYQAAGKLRHHAVAGGGSYQSAHDRRVILGMGDARTSGEITVRWPAGTVDVFKDLPLRQYHVLKEGSGPKP